MFCPGCGSGAIDGDRFCRTCGRNLEAEQPPLKVVAASPRPVRARRRLLPIALRLISVVGLVSSAVGTWSLLHADATPVRSPSSPIAQPPAAAPSPAASSSPTPSPVPTSPPVEWASWPTCSNASIGYEISYPTGWYTAESNDRLGCRFFDRSTFTVTTDSPLPTTAIRIYFSSNRFAKADLLYRKASGPWVLRRTSTQVDGHRAFMVEVRTSTGKAFATFIDMDGAALVIDTYSDYDHDFASAMSTVMLMSSSLTFSPVGSP
ncbi:MAG: hypothetical protein ACRDH7_07710 [Actinomycetota bacterium]